MKFDDEIDIYEDQRFGSVGRGFAYVSELIGVRTSHRHMFPIMFRNSPNV